MADFGRLVDGRVIDLRPMDDGGSWPLVFNPGRGWETFEGILGEITDSKPITEEEAKALTSGEV